MSGMNDKSPSNGRPVRRGSEDPATQPDRFDYRARLEELWDEQAQLIAEAAADRRKRESNWFWRLVDSVAAP